MARIYLIQILEDGRFLRPQPHGDPDIGARAGADLLSKREAAHVAEDMYGPDWEKRVRLVEATAGELSQFWGRMGGRAKSAKKTKACRENARKERL